METHHMAQASSVSRDLLTQKLVELRTQHVQAVANANALHGAIQMLEQLLAMTASVDEPEISS